MSIEAKKNQQIQEEQNPNLSIPQLKFLLAKSQDVGSDKEKVTAELMGLITKNKMAPYYKSVSEELGWNVDPLLLESMEQENQAQIQKFEDQLIDAQTNAGETEIREALLAKAEYLAKIGDKNAVEAFEKVYEKSVGTGNKLDVILFLIRIGFFFEDRTILTSYLSKAKKLIEEGGDWDRRNRLKVYEGCYLMSIRQFRAAADLFLDALPTFTCVELMDYTTFVKYTLICSMVSLDRVTTTKKVINAPEILEVIREIEHFELYVNSLYKCDYKSFFETLAKVEQVLKSDHFLFSHYRYYIREMKVTAYAQLLESYRSLTIQSMAEAFGVTEEFIDSELAKFIAGGRLNCVIDKVGGIVVTNRPDAKNAQYQSVIKQGDILLNRVQKLSRVINV